MSKRLEINKNVNKQLVYDEAFWHLKRHLGKPSARPFLHHDFRYLRQNPEIAY